MSMGVMALAIDAILPALTQIRRDLDLESDSTAVSALITAFLFGSGLGFVPAGLLADRFGRRPVLWGGLGLYIVGAAGAALAPSLAWMLVARVVWGIGAAGPRSAAIRSTCLLPRFVQGIILRLKGTVFVNKLTPIIHTTNWVAVPLSLMI